MTEFFIGMGAGLATSISVVMAAGTYAFKHPEVIAKMMMGGMRRVNARGAKRQP